ncbi:MAG: hypothetical protein ACREIT_07120 [Tepidisphaeraceae bacterium]
MKIEDGGAGASLARWLLSAYLLVLVAGFFVLRSPIAMVRGNELSFERAVFATINAGTLTGFQQTIETDTYLWPGQMAVLVLTWAGALFSLVAGGTAVARITRLPFTEGEVARTALLLTFGASVLGAVPLVFAGRSVLAAIFQATSAFGNGGLVMGRHEGAGGWPMHIVLLPLAVVGGLGVTVLMELWRRQPLSRHARTVLAWSAGLYLFGVVLLLLLQTPWDAAGGWPEALVLSSAASLDARTLGMPIDLGTLSRAGQWMLMGLMVIGAASGGTGGGLKVTIIPLMILGTRGALAGRTGGRVLGVALAWAGVYALVVIVSLLALLATEPQMPGDRLLFVAVSAASNVGLSHDPISITGAGLHVLSVTMLLGRLAPVAVLWWMAKTTPEADVAAG